MCNSGEHVCGLFGAERERHSSVAERTTKAAGRFSRFTKHFNDAPRTDVRTDVGFAPLGERAADIPTRLFITALNRSADLTDFSPVKTIIIAYGTGRWTVSDSNHAWGSRSTDKLVIGVDNRLDFMVPTSYREHIVPMLKHSLRQLVIICHPAEVTKPRDRRGLFSKRPPASTKPFTFVNSGHVVVPESGCICQFCGILIECVGPFVDAEGLEEFLEQHASFLTIDEYTKKLAPGEWMREVGE